ncbi:MAG TPA: ABC transporter permease [Gemmatimonadaceae bacterium]|nr:ABC transporter permease [Gemmatimonadaceae bacterium]
MGTAAIAVGIALGTIYFEVVSKWQNPRLPGPYAGRVVSIRNWDASANALDPHALHDFAVWREQLKSLDYLGASLPFDRNLQVDDGQLEPVHGVEITPGAFAVVGQAPQMGRALTQNDAQPGQPRVAVISYALWQSRFDGVSTVLGQSVKVGTDAATIVGVMPKGFRFPVNARIWLPLRMDGSQLAPRTGPSISIFGRLRPGASLQDAQSEIALVQARLAAADPAAYAHLRPRVTTYAKPLGGSEFQTLTRIIYGVNVVFLALLAVLCTNVATLVFARTAARGWELTVRTALGASRRRIIVQLFLEALVLVGLATGMGLVVAKLSLHWGLGLFGGSAGMPYWINDGVSWQAIGYAVLLALLGAMIVGVVPALRATRFRVGDALRNASSAHTAIRFGAVWTLVIVAQIAIAVALMPMAANGITETNRFAQRADGIGAAAYLTARPEMDRAGYGTDTATLQTRSHAAFAALERRLLQVPGVEGVAFASRLPVMDQFKYHIAVDTAGLVRSSGIRTSTLVQVSQGFFATFGASVALGRGFTPADFANGSAIIVNQSFVRYVLSGQNPIGRRIQIVSGEDNSVAGKAWYHIVGVVKDFGWQMPLPQEQSALYLPRDPETIANVSLAVRVRDRDQFAGQLRKVAAEAAPSLLLTNVEGLEHVGDREAQINRTLTWVAWVIWFVILALSTTGIYALMSFTVTRRTREIGIRVALGASRSRILTGIGSRALLQIGAGMLLGTILISLRVESFRGVTLLILTNALMIVAGLTACAIPLRRALRVSPMEALRADG